MADGLEVGDLVVKLRADLSDLKTSVGRMENEFKQGFSRTQTEAQAFSNRLKSSMATIGASIGVAFGGAAIGAAIVGFGKRLADIGDELSDLADRTGHSISVLGGLKPILDASGSSVGAFANTISIAQRNLGNATEESQGAAAALKQLGLNVNELKQLSPDEFLERTAKALGGIENRSERAAIGSRIFGRSWAEISPTIEKISSQGLPRLSAEAEAGYKALGNLKDAMVQAAGEATNFWAALLGKGVKALGIGELSFADELALKEKHIRALVDSLKSRLGDQASENPAVKQLELQLAGITRMQARLQDIEANKKKSGSTAIIDPALIEKSQSQFRQFTESLETNLEGLRGKLADAIFGEGASLGDQLDGELKRFKDKLAAEKLPIPAGLDATFAKLKTAIIEADGALRGHVAQQKDLEQQYKSIDEQTQKITAAEKELLNVTRALDAEGYSELDKALAEVNKRFDEFRIRAVTAAEITGQSTDEIKRRIEAMRGQQLLAIQQPFGTGPGDDEEMDLGKRLEVNAKRLQAGRDIMADFTRAQAQIATSARVFGSTFDVNAAAIDNVKKSIQALIGQGFTELDPKVQELNAKLKNLEGIQSMQKSFENVFDAIGSGIDETLKGVMQGTADFGDQMKNMMRNIGLSIASELNKQFIVNPIREGLRSLLPAQQKPGQAPGDGTSDAAQKAREGFIDLNSIISEGLQKVLQQSQSGFTGLFQGLGSLISQGLEALKGLGGGEGGGLLSGIGQGISTAFTFIKGLFSGGAEKGGLIPRDLLPAFAKGGPVFTAESMGIKIPELRFGAGGEVPAILHQGEFVFRKAAVDRIGIPALKAMNEGLVFPHVSPSLFDVPRQRFDNGGAVAAMNMSGAASGMGRRPIMLKQETIIHGSVSPNPGFNEQNCIETVLRDADNDGPIMQTLKVRISGGSK